MTALPGAPSAGSVDSRCDKWSGRDHAAAALKLEELYDWETDAYIWRAEIEDIGVPAPDPPRPERLVGSGMLSAEGPGLRGVVEIFLPLVDAFLRLDNEGVAAGGLYEPI